MPKLYQALFGVRVTVVYKNGVKIQARMRKFKFNGEAGVVHKIEWCMPILGRNDALFINVDEVYAIWQGHV